MILSNISHTEMISSIGSWIAASICTNLLNKEAASSFSAMCLFLGCLEIGAGNFGVPEITCVFLGVVLNTSTVKRWRFYTNMASHHVFMMV